MHIVDSMFKEECRSGRQKSAYKFILRLEHLVKGGIRDDDCPRLTVDASARPHSDKDNILALGVVN